MAKKKVADKKNLNLRPPVVTIMGHVDHGKTTLLDYIRKTKVAEKEHGGITQHLGAYQVEEKGNLITFIDTPGHEAFGQMRARGAQVTDLVILVVAADDGVMPQTKESINHIKAAGVPMIVAINKMDLPGANIERVKKGLAEVGVLVEGYGGNIVAVPISAKTGEGVEDLLEMVNLVAEMAELKDESEESFEGVVIESSLDKFRGPLATLLVKKGKISVGEAIYTRTVVGKVRSLVNSTGDSVKEITVSTPSLLLGFEKVPVVGETVKAGLREIGAEKQVEIKEKKDPFATKADLSEINIIIKADVAGSLEAIVTALEKLENKEQKVNFIEKETGEINESDVLLAASTRAIIIGFNVKISKAAEKLSEEEKVIIRTFNIIYQLIDELKEGLNALVSAKKVEVLGQAVIITIFETSFGKVAGSKVNEGRFTRGDKVNIVRDKEIVSTGRVKSIRQKQDEVTTVRNGEECGILIDTKGEFAEGDIIEATA